MTNTYLRKDHQGKWVDKTPDIWATVNYKGAFVLSTRRYGAEADLGVSLVDSTRRDRSIRGVVTGSLNFGIEKIAKKFEPIARELGVSAEVLPDGQKTEGSFFEYDVWDNGKIYVVRVVGTRKSKPIAINKVLQELKK